MLAPSPIPGWWTVDPSWTRRCSKAQRVDGLFLQLAGSDGEAQEGPPVWRVVRPDKDKDLGEEIGVLPTTLSLRAAIDRADREWPPPSWIRVAGEAG